MPDAIATELLGFGLNIVERTTLSQMVRERGLDLTEILNGEEYFKLGEITKVSKVVIVSSRMKGVGVANATVRIVDTKSGAIILSTTYTQPAPNNPIYARHHSLVDTAKQIAESIKAIVK